MQFESPNDDTSASASGILLRPTVAGPVTGFLVGFALLFVGVANAEHNEVLYAWKAALTGNLKLHDEKEAATIHFWNQAEDTITWNWHATKPGNYLVELNYSLNPSLKDGRILLMIGGQQIIAPAVPSAGWTEYKTFPLGVVAVEKAGKQSVVLKAAQLPTAQRAAMPDIAWLSLTPTDGPATSESTLPAPDFKGKPLFDGSSLAGWEGDGKYFRIVDGTIVAGGLAESIPQNEFLCTTREYGDFELRIKARMTDGRGNGGVQFRSHRVKDSRELQGYQADCGDRYWGGVYDESRRRRFLGTRLNGAEMKQALKPADWNEYVIRCEGLRTRIWLNGVQTLDYLEADPSIPLKGHIGVQIHQGGPAEASYKDILLQEIPAASDK